MYMGGGRGSWTYLGLCLLLLLCLINSSLANFVFNVDHKFGGRESGMRTLSALREHDEIRHGRSLSAIDIPLGGDGSPTGTALYYTKIGLGSPSKDYYVQVDTGSDLMWVNCAGCDNCPKKSSLDIPLTLYNPKRSKTGAIVTCDQEFCAEAINPSSCKVGDMCAYSLTYGDGSSSRGYFVTDTIQLNKASADLQTVPMNGSVGFGCGARQNGQLGQSDQAVDGILGFGRANSSVLSQLALAGKVKKIFSHCLDADNGGGIFTIGELVHPKVNSTPFVPDLPHYNLKMIGVEVNNSNLELSSGELNATSGRDMVIDSGTTLAYLEEDLYEPLVKKILGAEPGLKTYKVQNQFTCFNFSGNVDKAFPVVIFRFDDSLSLTIHPHDYFFEYADGDWCVGWQNSGVKINNGKAINILGDLVLGNRLVVYDNEKNTIGWTDYNCSTSVKMKDGLSGAQYLVGSHDISYSLASTLSVQWAFVSLLSLFVLQLHIVSSSKYRRYLNNIVLITFVTLNRYVWYI